MSLAKQVLKKLSEMECPILDTYYTKGKYIICSDIMILSCEGKKLSVLFHVGVKADESASIILELNNLDSVKEISVENIFVFVENMDNVIIGDDALKAYEYTMRRDIINEFVEQQKQIATLMKLDENKCLQC